MRGESSKYVFTHYLIIIHESLSLLSVPIRQYPEKNALTHKPGLGETQESINDAPYFRKKYHND